MVIWIMDHLAESSMDLLHELSKNNELETGKICKVVNSHVSFEIGIREFHDNSMIIPSSHVSHLWLFLQPRGRTSRRT